jgi:hypothetical protein
MVFLCVFLPMLGVHATSNSAYSGYSELWFLRYPAHRHRAVPSPGFEPTTLWLGIQRPNHLATMLHKSWSRGYENLCLGNYATRKFIQRAVHHSLKHLNTASHLWPALAKGGSWGQILKMSCWYGLILHKIIFKMMYDTWQSLDNWLTISWQLTEIWTSEYIILPSILSSSWLQLFFEKTSSKGKLGTYFKMKSIRNSNVSAVLLNNYIGL